MASIDVVASILQELEPDLNELFTQWHPLLDKIVKGKRFPKAKGHYRQFRVVTGGPGAGRKIQFGNELLASTRRQNYKLGDQYASRSIYLFDIPGIDMAQVSGDKAAMKALIKTYPESALNDVYELLASQVARAAGSSGSSANAGFLDGMLTLNGDQDYTPDSGAARDGVFQFAAPASQTNTVFGVAMQGAASGTTGWYHQFGQVTSFAVNGREVMRKVRDDANSQGGKTSGEVDLLLGDPQSYQNYLNDLDEHVETVVVKGDHTPAAIRSGTKFGNADFFSEVAIDITDTTSFSTAAAQAGVIYNLNSGEWDGFALGEDDKMETKGLFSFRGPTRVPDMDAWRFELVNYWNIYCRQLRNQGVVVGSATR